MKTQIKTIMENVPAVDTTMLENTLEGEHVIGAFIGKADGPTLIAVGSVHGNEPGGAIALSNVAKQLSQITDKLNGRVYFLAGNTRAIRRGTRFIDADLNRHWTAKNMSRVGNPVTTEISEGLELSELDRIFDSVLITAQDEVYVLDLHSTSADGMPFATVGDTLRNREFARKFPVTILLGIEEQLDGTMLEYLNNAGAVTLGFEGGQHRSEKTVANHEALVWIALVNSGILKGSDISNYEVHIRQLAESNKRPRILEVRYRHPIHAEDGFEMRRGFNNFDPIRKGQFLARDKNGEIPAPESGLLLMPLYQKLGEDGFFIGRYVAVFWLWVSALLRRLRVQKLVRILPGVVQDPNDVETLIVNTQIARLFPLQIFHLLGYRRRRWSRGKLIVSRRKHDVQSPFRKSR